MNNTKLILNFVIDNSASMKGERIIKLKNALQNFDSELNSLSLTDKIEYSITIFKGFNSTIFKGYETKLNIDNFFAGGIPFVNDALVTGVKGLLNRVETLGKASIDVYKPWTILLLNGENYDNLDESVELILKIMKAGQMSYFPFALTDCEFDKSLGNLRKIKPFTVIKDEKYGDLFNWILDIAKSRVEKPKSEPITISPKSFEGWTIK